MMQSEELLFLFYFFFRKKLNTIRVLPETLVLANDYIVFSVLLSFKEVCSLHFPQNPSLGSSSFVVVKVLTSEQLLVVTERILHELCWCS